MTGTEVVEHFLVEGQPIVIGTSPSWRQIQNTERHTGEADDVEQQIKDGSIAQLSYGTPPVHAEGDLYYGTPSPSIVKRPPSGENVWEQSTAAAPVRFALASDRLFYRLDNGDLGALSTSDGSQLWELTSNVYGDIAHDGSYLYAFYDDNGGFLGAYNFDGTQNANIALPEGVSPITGQYITIGPGGDVYFALDNGSVNSVTGGDLNLYWFTTSISSPQSPVFSNNLLYVQDYATGNVHALDPATEGAVWTFNNPDAAANGNIAVSETHGLVIASGSSNVYALDADTGDVVDSGTGPFFEPPVIIGDVVYGPAYPESQRVVARPINDLSTVLWGEPVSGGLNEMVPYQGTLHRYEEAFQAV